MVQRITAARITEMPKTLFDPMPKVMVRFNTDQNTEVELFQYYPEEITFTEQEFIGLTREQALTLKQEKDQRFLQSK